MSYSIKVVEFCKRGEVLFWYEASTHPSKDGVIEVNGRSYTVVSVRDILHTVDKGTYNERVKFGHVELEVML